MLVFFVRIKLFINQGRHMNNDKLLYGVIGFIIGALVTWLFASYVINGNHGNMMRWMGFRYNGYSGMMNFDNR